MDELYKLIQAGDINQCQEYFKNHSLSQLWEQDHAGVSKLLDTAIKTDNVDMINFIFGTLNILDYQVANILALDLEYIAEHKMLGVFHTITLCIANILPDYDRDFHEMLRSYEDQISDEFILTMLNSTIKFVQGFKDS